MYYNLLKNENGYWFYLVKTHLAKTNDHVSHIMIYDAEQPSEKVWLASVEISGVGQRVVSFEDLFVTEEVRRTGLGKSIVRAAIEYAISESAQVVELCCYGELLGFYKSLGFEVAYKLPETLGDKDFDGLYRLVYAENNYFTNPSTLPLKGNTNV